MKQRILIIAIFTMSIASLRGQHQYDFKVKDESNRSWRASLFSWSLKDDTTGRNFGPNRSFFQYMTLGYGITYGEQEGNDADHLDFTGNYKLGYVFKFKISPVFSGGFNLLYSRTAFKIDQGDDGKTFPDSIAYKKQKLAFHEAVLDPYLRINFDPKRGNHMGNYLDLGAYGSYTVGARLISVKEDPVNDEHIKTVRSNLSYINRMNYGLSARLGFNQFMLFGRYRLSDRIEQDKVDFVLPRFTFGIQIGVWE